MAAKKIKNSKRLKKLAPSELEDIWDEDTAEIWASLRINQQQFFIEYISNGGKANQAYLKVINDLATEDVAKSAGPRMLASVGLSALLRKMSDNKAYELIAIKKVYLEGMEAFKPVFTKDAEGQPELVEDIPDHMTRKSCADSLAKINGELIEKSERSVKIQNNIQINAAQMGDINGYLETIGAAPLKAAVKPVAVKSEAFQKIVSEITEEEEVLFGSFGDEGIGVID